MIARPYDCDTATVRGAAQYGLARRPLVSSVVAPQSYMLKVRWALDMLHLLSHQVPLRACSMTVLGEIACGERGQAEETSLYS